MKDSVDFLLCKQHSYIIESSQNVLYATSIQRLSKSINEINITDATYRKRHLIRKCYLQVPLGTSHGNKQTCHWRLIQCYMHKNVKKLIEPKFDPCKGHGELPFRIQYSVNMYTYIPHTHTQTNILSLCVSAPWVA